MIDGTAFCYRAFYAIRQLSTSDGRPTNAVYGFAMMLQALREKEQPDYLAVAFDAGKPTFRHKQFEAYKMQRKPMPDPLISQLPLVKRLLSAYRIPVFQQEGYEGEDLLASLAQRIVTDHVEVYLVTGDKDALQLVNARIKVYNPHKEHVVLDAGAVRQRYGVEPTQMVDVMALMGDAIDNIPGVPGIGEKTAIQLIQQFGSVEKLYVHLDELESPSRRNALMTHRDQVEQSRSLARIDPNVPLEVSLDDLKVQEPDWRALRQLFRELEFKRLLHDIDQQAPVGTASMGHVNVATSAELATLLARWRDATTPVAVLGWAVPPEAPGKVMMALALDPEEAWLVPSDAAGQAFAAWLADDAAPKVSHDAKALTHLLRHAGLTLAGIVGDTMIAAYLANPSRTTQTLSDLADEHLGTPLGPTPPLDDLEALDSHDIQERMGCEAIAVKRLHEVLLEQLEARGLTVLYRTLEIPLLKVLAEMEATGIAVDVAYLNGLHASMDAKLRQLIEEIERLAGGAFNVNSPKQLAQVLFERLGLPVIKRTKTGPSTDSDVLRQLAERHPLPKLLMEYRELAKLVSTYVDALPQLADPATGRIHTSWNQTATATGRLSSSEPNLQNIPVKTELGRSIRKAFIPGIRDGVLVAADYSQIELRILAHLSGDEHLAEAFRQQRDIHRFTASLIYGLPEDEVQSEQRNAMKAVNFGIIYGMSAHGLSKELGIPHEEAQAFIEAYFQRYPRVREYLDRQIAQVKRDGFVQTLLGRRRYIPEVHSSDPMIRQLGERMAINAPVQGSAADVIKRAMIDLAQALTQRRCEARMLLQVHDELVLECPKRELPDVTRLVREVMEGAITLTVPLTVAIKAGPNWLDLREVQ